MAKSNPNPNVNPKFGSSGALVVVHSARQKKHRHRICGKRSLYCSLSSALLSVTAPVNPKRNPNH